MPSILTLVAFPPGHFIENLSVRADNSLLITLFENKQLYFVPAGRNPTPILLKTFDNPTLGICQLHDDEFFVATSDPANPQSSDIWRFDFAKYSPGTEFNIEHIISLPDAEWLNGMCALEQSQRALLIADSKAACIWRVDVDTRRVSCWLEHEATMRNKAGGDYAAAPGINGIHYDHVSHHLYYTLTVPGMLLRVPVQNSEPFGEVEVVHQGIPGADDFVLDFERKGAWIATHIANGIDFVGFDGDLKPLVGGFGRPIVEELIGATAVAWSRAPEEEGKVLYVTTEGGCSLPVDGRVREGRLVRVEL